MSSNMELPLLYFLYVYAFFALLGALFLFFNIYHISKFGLQAGKTYLVLLLYVVGYLLILGGSFLFIVQIDWSKDILLGDLLRTLFAPTLDIFTPKL